MTLRANSYHTYRSVRHLLRPTFVPAAAPLWLKLAEPLLVTLVFLIYVLLRRAVRYVKCSSEHFNTVTMMMEISRYGEQALSLEPEQDARDFCDFVRIQVRALDRSYTLDRNNAHFAPSLQNTLFTSIPAPRLAAQS